MSLLRSPTGSGIDARLGGSQPNLSELSSETTLRYITHRNKRKTPDDDDLIRTELFELRKQMSEMMGVLKSINSDQAENINTLRKDVGAIKDELGNISNTIESIITENKNLKQKITTLISITENTEKKVNLLEADVNNLKSASPLASAQAPETCEEVISEIQERNARAKNIVVVGIPESKASMADERQEYDKTEILKVIKAMHKDYPQPNKIFVSVNIILHIAAQSKYVFQPKKS